MNIKQNETKGMDLLQYLLLRGKRIFTMQDVLEANAQQKVQTSQAQLRKILSNLAKQKKILRLSRGIYVSMGLLPEHPHPLVVSAFLIQPSAISHWSALQYHGMTEQIPKVITAITTQQVMTPSRRGKTPKPLHGKHAWEIGGIFYEYMTVKPEHYEFGIDKNVWIDQYFYVCITDKERTMLDVFVSPKMFGGIGGALGILEDSLSSIDIKKLVDYAIKYGNKSVIKRLGWALEYFGIVSEIYLPLLEVPMNYYCKLDPAGVAKGHCDKRWMIQNNLIKEKK